MNQPTIATMFRAALCCAAIMLTAATDAQTQTAADPRNIKSGFVIPDEGYSDQPYVVITNDGAWLCVMTTGKGVEGEGGQHIVATISKDKGRTWSPLIDIEPATGPEASWAVPLKTPGGRVYVFYTYNKANIREVPNGAGPRKRVDTLGVYAFKYSDDNGRSWPKDLIEESGRYYITETQKSVARVHEIDPALLEGLWRQAEAKEVARAGLALNLSGDQLKAGASVEAPQLPNPAEGKGFTIDFWVKLKELSPGQVIFDARNSSGKGIALTLSDRFTIKLTMSDGRVQSEWDSDPGTHPGTLKVNAWQHVAAGRIGNTGRNLLTGPAFFNADAVLSKRFHMPRLPERVMGTVRVEVFNVFNNVNFNTRSINGDITSSSAGAFTLLQGNPRQMQFGFRVDF